MDKQARKRPFSIEICSNKQVDKLIRFIDLHWKKDHIFTKSRELFDWQHKTNDETYNFIISQDETGEILGIFGFIPLSHFSKDLLCHNQSWMALWKVRDDCPHPGLGVGMLNYFIKIKNFDTVCAVGLSEEVKPLYKTLKYNLGSLKHYVVFNRKVTSYKFIEPPELTLYKCRPSSFEIDQMNEQSIRGLTKEEADRLFFRQPIKDAEYIINRFLKHPIYKYKVFSIKSEENNLLTIFTLRFINIKETMVARVVDFQGDSLLSPQFNSILLDWIAKKRIEYMDVMFYEDHWHLSDESCFFDVADYKELIVPNYFEPLVMENRPLDFAYKSNKEGIFSIFKGDSDQDRPNSI